MYHAVDDKDDPHAVQVTPTRLRQQFGVLRRMGLRGVSVRELMQTPSTKTRRVGLTFDDGYADFATEAMPLLAEFGFTASVYVVVGRLGGVNGWDNPPVRSLMTAEQVRAAHGAGHEIGSHGLKHVRLSTQSPDTLGEEIVESKRLLEGVIASPVTGFCYPYGDRSPQVRAMVCESYDYACAAAPGIRGDRWAIPRFHVGQSDGPSRMVAKLALRPVRDRFGHLIP
jgi:peptidoglycan/xylan/chitin deacetylase (PgdA/CDA1 family)